MRCPCLAILLVACSALLGCAAPPIVAQVPERLLRDAAFAPPATPVNPGEIFALSEAMQRYIHSDMAPLLRAYGPRQGLIRALQRRGVLRLEYDAAMTRTASQAFEARSGNCLSLVLMTAAFARELGLEVHYQSVVSEEIWSRSADLYVVSGHVNLTLGRQRLGEAAGYDPARQLTIDFLPAQDIAGQRVQPLSEQTVLAMFMNNRAAEAMASNDLDTAYAWARAALRQDPAFHAAYNTLGVIYLRHDDPAAAEQVLRHVLARDPGHTQALANLVLAVRHQGRATEADQLAAELARVEPRTPFHYFALGMAALKAGDALAARELFKKELVRDPDYHESHFAMALAEWRLGHADEASRQLSLALANSTQRHSRDLYAAKLDWLKSQESPQTLR